MKRDYKLLKRTRFSYPRATGNQIKIIAAFLFYSLLAFSYVSQAQSQVVTGSIKDENGAALQGVSVLVKGSSEGVSSDADGRFSIALPGSSAVLVISHIGYATQEVPVTAGSVQDISLKRDVNALNEVVVIGYGSQRRKDVTGSVSTIDLSATKDVPVANPGRLLVGQAPGVTVRQPTGRPGSEFDVVVRGLGSLGAGSQPLYVIDGFPIGNQLGQNFNPNDIENISILKDAVSTAIYGARGSNGVVLITTKSAKSGQSSLNVTANYGIQNIPSSRKVKMLNGQEFAQFKKDIFMDKIRYFEQREPSIDEVPLDYRYPEQTTISTNWYDEILHNNAPFQNYNVTLSQGNANFRSLLSAGYMRQEGVLINTNFDNISVRGNMDGKVNDFINMGLNINGSYATNNLARATEGRDNIVGSALLMDPREPVYNEDGSYNDYIGGHDGTFGWPNPVQSLKDILRKEETGQLLSNGYVEISFLRNFKFKTSGNALLNYSNYKQFVPSTIAGVNAPPPRDASEVDQSLYTKNYSTDQLLTYNNSFGDHRLNVLLGYTAQEETTKVLDGSGSQFPNDLTPFLSSAALKTSGSSEYGWSMNAVFGRINYSYSDKYLLSATFRREGSSRFGESNKYGNFPAFSAGWRVLNEKFMPKIGWLTDLKLRGSWGITGNNNIGNYSSLAFMSDNNYIIGNNLARGLIVTSLANPSLGWERSKQLDLGVDVSAFKDKLSFTAEFYNKITSDMLLPIQVPAISGFTTYLSNVGKVQNKGFEFALRYRTNINKVGVWANANVSINRNKVLEIRGENDQILYGSLYEAYNISRVGRPIGMLYGFRMLGIFNNQEEIDKSPTQDGAIPGVYKYYDGDGDGVISYDTRDMVEIGNPWPKFTYGLTLGGNYKNFDISILLNGAYGYDIYRQIEASTMNMDGVFNVLEESKDRWRSEENPGTGKYATTNTWKWERESNSRYIYSGSHLWVKNISVGYTLSKTGMSFKSLRVYASADNFLLITNYPGSNPDVNNRGGINPGLDDESYPLPRTFTFGVNFTF
ncbi:TonB-dependent receptor [Ilyomonas limi]|uniref:TonB-dependent receptor n=1 Tax=Ilyomonas limi TaxID=2575867 RepID=A0A4U3L7N5_9BACT|nr:TonB-dependent receptor [Ilyomonas limi]TKK71042.1 TonB-dependent receptor [Ilyomonas limi]